MIEKDCLDEEVAIVTGAGRNIGKAIAETFAKHGAKTVIADLNEERAKQTANSITEAGGNAMAIQVDVSDESSIEAMLNNVEEKFGTITILVNNAAVIERTSFLNLSPEEFDKTIDVNLRGTFLCSQKTAESMIESGRGRIVNIASTSAHVARPDNVAYAASKNGVLSFTKSIANALSDHDIRVNAISPTRSGSQVGKAEERSGPVDDDILVNRWGEPQDLANAALFLVSSQSEFVNGTELIVDGGAMARSY